MASIILSYTRQSDSTVYTVTIDEFTDKTLPRSYVSQTQFSFSGKGTSLISGPAYQEKRIWAVSAYLTKQEAIVLDTLYREWDNDRAAGYAAALSVTDSTFGTTLVTQAVVSTPPTFTKVGVTHMICTIGVTEV